MKWTIKVRLIFNVLFSWLWNFFTYFFSSAPSRSSFPHLLACSLSLSFPDDRTSFHVHFENDAELKSIIISHQQHHSQKQRQWQQKHIFLWKFQIKPHTHGTHVRTTLQRYSLRLYAYTNTGIKDEFRKTIGNYLSMHFVWFSLLSLPINLPFFNLVFALDFSCNTQYMFLEFCLVWSDRVWIGLSWFVVVLITMFDVLLPQNVCVVCVHVLCTNSAKQNNCSFVLFHLQPPSRWSISFLSLQ